MSLKTPENEKEADLLDVRRRFSRYSRAAKVQTFGYSDPEAIAPSATHWLFPFLAGLIAGLLIARFFQ